MLWLICKILIVGLGLATLALLALFAVAYHIGGYVLAEWDDA